MSTPSDQRIVMTLDAGGTNFVFSAIQAIRAVVESFALPAHSGDLERSLELSGGKRPIVEESKCRTRGDEYCQFDVNWD